MRGELNFRSTGLLPKKGTNFRIFLSPSNKAIFHQRPSTQSKVVLTISTTYIGEITSRRHPLACVCLTNSTSTSASESTHKAFSKRVIYYSTRTTTPIPTSRFLLDTNTIYHPSHLLDDRRKVRSTPSKSLIDFRIDRTSLRDSDDRFPLVYVLSFVRVAILNPNRKHGYGKQIDSSLKSWRIIVC